MARYDVDSFPGRSRSPSATWTGTRTWRRLRARVLRRDGYECQIRGARCRGDAVAVDHIKPVFLCDEEEIFDEDNCRAVCQPCHDEKTARERRLAVQMNGYPVLPTMRTRKRGRPIHPCEVAVGMPGGPLRPVERTPTGLSA